MEVSPLTLQARPSSFQPKIDRLYEDLFKQDDEDYADADGFWGEFFLLNPDKASLQRRLEALTTEDLLQLQDETQQLFVRAIQQVKGGKSPTDEHALDVCRMNLPMRPNLKLTGSDFDGLPRCDFDETVYESKC